MCIRDRGYTDGYLRKSVVKDPLIRENTKDNTPAVSYTHLDVYKRQASRRSPRITRRMTVHVLS